MDLGYHRTDFVALKLSSGADRLMDDVTLGGVINLNRMSSHLAMRTQRYIARGYADKGRGTAVLAFQILTRATGLPYAVYDDYQLRCELPRTWDGDLDQAKALAAVMNKSAFVYDFKWNAETFEFVVNNIIGRKTVRAFLRTSGLWPADYSTRLTEQWARCPRYKYVPASSYRYDIIEMAEDCKHD
jgi:hypothetical protein